MKKVINHAMEAIIRTACGCVSNTRTPRLVRAHALVVLGKSYVLICLFTLTLHGSGLVIYLKALPVQTSSGLYSTFGDFVIFLYPSNAQKNSDEDK